jgi:Rrf2 family transcriptional regulator, iron-sulfur cluster assembly transcription factor
MIRRDRVMLAVGVMLDVAFHGSRNATVSAVDLSERLGIARRGMEPLLQGLSRAGLLDSVRGPRGGYRLARPRRDIRLADIVAVVASEDGPAAAQHNRLQAVVDGLWDEMEREVMARLEGLALDDLVRRAEAAGLQRPNVEPISFAI